MLRLPASRLVWGLLEPIDAREPAATAHWLMALGICCSSKRQRRPGSRSSPFCIDPHLLIYQQEQTRYLSAAIIRKKERKKEKSTTTGEAF